MRATTRGPAMRRMRKATPLSLHRIRLTSPFPGRKTSAGRSTATCSAATSTSAWSKRFARLPAAVIHWAIRRARAAAPQRKNRDRPLLRSRKGVCPYLVVFALEDEVARLRAEDAEHGARGRLVVP